MGKNNPLRSMTPKNKNYKLYKAKKQWITACATFMLAFGATAVVNASVQADTTTSATTQASGSTATVAASTQPQSAAAETAQNTDETKRNVVANTTDTSRTSEQKTTTAQATENSSSASSVNKTNSEEENKNAFLTFNVNTADTPANEAIQENKIVATTATTTNGGFTQPIILASGNLCTLLSNKNNTTHDITSKNADSGQSTTISLPVVYDAASASNMTDAINSYKDMIDQKLEDYVTEHNYVLKRVSTDPVDDVTGHNNHLVNFANATYQVVTIPADQKKNLQIQDKTTYKGKTLTAKDLVTNVADFPSGTTFEFADNSEPNWDQVGTYNVKVIATYPVSVNGQQYTAVTAPATAKVTVTQQMQFTITYWDDTENKEITQFDIKNAGNGGYSINLKFPAGVDAKKYQSVGVTGVPEGATIAGDYWKPFTDRSCNWRVPNYKWDATAAPSLFNANVVVHLVHKTQDVTNTDPAAQETRTVTVNYVKTKVNEDGTYTEAGNAFTSAVLDVYYTRQATKDLVTGDITYGPWQWNTKKGDSSTPGYHVVSGTWTSLPQEWATVTTDVPTLDGYTAYTGGPATNTNKVPANQFVFPTWNGSDGDTSDISKGSTAYTTAAPLYEAQPVHTIFYVPNKTEARTITAKFVYAGGDKNGQSVAPDAQIQVFFKQAGTINASTNKVVYGGWTWDKTVGDEDSLGFHVISGKWNIAQDGQFTVTPADAGNDYVVANINSTGTYTTVNFANPNYHSNTVFTTNNAPQWYVRNELTTYYVPKSLTQKTINRVINLTPVNQLGTPSVTQTTTQSATITRPVKVNADDSGVVFDGFDGSGWTTGKWGRYNNIPVLNNYTKVIKQIVTHPDGTTTETTLNIPNCIPAQTVTIDTLPTVINITYTATATAFLAGTNESTYTGQPITLSDLNYGNGDDRIHVGITGPTGNVYALQAGDVEFSSDNGQTWTTEMPTNAGTYELRWSKQGKQEIIKEFGNNSIKWVDAQGNSTFTSTATYIINPAPVTLTLSNQTSGNYTKIYDAQPTTSIDLSKLTITADFNNAKVALNTTSLTSDSYEWVDAQGNSISNPENVGTYYIKLKDAALSTLQKDNPNFTLTNGSGLATYTITPASANTELSGHNSMVYNGNSVTTADLYTDGSTIKVAISGNNIVNLPTSFTLADGDYAWNTPDGKAPVNAGSYTLTLSSAGLDKVQAAIDEAVGKGNVILSKGNTGNATFQITQAVSPDVQLNGNEKSEYNGHAVSFDPNNEETKKNFGFNNVQGLTIPDLTANDFEWVDQDGNLISAPTDVDYYYLQLNEKGKSAFANANPNYTFVKDGNSTISGRITYHIYPASLIIGVSGTASQVYNGQNAAITQTQLDNGDIKLVWGNSNDEPIGLGSFTLTPEDLEVVDSAGNPVSHVNAQENDKTGNPAYYVRLTSAALNKIKNLTGASNYDISLGNATGDFLIYARKSQVTLNGNQTTTYGTDLPLDPSAYHIELTNWNSSVPGPTDAEIIQKIGGLKTGDVYINGFTDGQMPVNVGSYQVKIADQLLQKLKVAFPDYDWDAVSENNGTARTGSSNSDPIDARHEPATYVITPADTTVTINGAEHIKYGENSTIQYVGDNGYSITITAPVKNATTNNEHEPIYTDLKLETGDLEFVTTPGNVGTYEVKLSAQGLKKLQALTSSTNYNWTQASEARANFFVDQMPVTITVGGNGQNVTYGSNDWLKAIKENPQGYTLTVKTENGATLNYQAKDGDLIFSQTPGDVGSYQVVLSSQGLDNIKQALGTNYAYPQAASDITTYGTFTVNPGEVTISLDGSDSKIYDGKTTVPADLNIGKYNLDYSVTVYAPDGTAQTIQLTSADLQFANGDPINAGTYTVELSPAGQAKLKNLTGNNGDNYKWTFNTKATYTINSATDASASLSGSNQMIFNDSAVTTAEINNGGNIVVNLTFPGSTENSIYHLKDGDYIWTNGEAPTNVGTYTIKLTQAGLAHLQAAIDQYAGSGNAKISANSLTGSATFEIVPKSITDVTISGNDQEKTYDGQAASLDVNDLTISATNLVPDSPLSMKDITASDFDWYDAQGKKLDAIPTDAGTYEARLKPSALQALQKANPNYSFNTASGMIKYTINQKAATDTLGGNGNKVYNGQETTVSDVLNSITWTPSGLVDGQSLDLSKLSDADYAWYTKHADGTYTEMVGLPTNAGTYYLKLKDSSIAKIQVVNPNYSFATGAISGEYTYVISQANAVITLPNTSDQTVTWTGNPATIDPANFIPEITTDNPNEKTIALPSTLQLTASDYEFLQKGQVISIPSEIGTYQVRLTRAGWQKVQNAIVRNNNYTWNYQGKGNYHIEKATATITLDGSASSIYTASPVVIPATNGVVNGISVKLSNGQTYVLKPEDLEFVNDQGNPIPAPTDAGSYKVRLTEAALGQIRNLESNHYNYTYNNDVIDFTIEKANADVTTSGSYDVVYNGQTPEINVDKITNTISTNNGVDLTAPTLSADDYEWVDEDGKVIANPVNVGTYYLKLKDSSQSKIATNNNYTWNFNGLASVTINKANATISFGGSQETTYTGSIVAVNPGNYEVKLSNGQTYQLTDKDIQVIGSPINVGTYQVELSQAGIDAIKAADSNYNYSYDGSQGLLVIVPAKASATISGSQTTQDLELDPSRYTVMVNGQTITGLTTSDFIFSKDGHPAQLTEAGTYDVELSGNAINQLRNENPNYDITFSSTATFTLENSSQTINYVDADGKVISASSVGGKLKGNQVEFTPQFPAGWVASDPSSVPSEITLENEITTIKIKHSITNVDHTNPVPDGEKTVTGSAINGAHENDLNQTITRTIVVTKPDGTKQTIPQAAKIYRNATYDDVTGDVTYGEWSTAKWDAYTPENIPGYTVSESIVPAVEVKNGQQDETVNITYIANEQTGKISYQDAAGKEIGSTTITGKTGETITITPEIPAGWQLVSGQEIPKTVTVTSNGIPTIIVKVEHGTVVVTPETPATDIPTGKVPGEPSKNYPIMEQLTVTPTRTINIKYPRGEEQLIPQKVTFTRTAIFDEVTGEIKYTKWLPQGTAQWASYQPTTVTGYVPSQKIVPAMTVNPETPNETVDITYDKIPEPQEGQEIISYQDANGQVIHTQTVTGEEDSDVSFKPEVPTNWQPTGDLPHSVKITGGTTVIVIEPVTVPVQEHKTVTRIIIEHLPSGDKQTVQTVVLTGTGTKNLVTGEVTDVKWDHGKFAAFTPATVPGYTTNMRIVPEIDVTAASGDSIVEINYIPNEQTGFIIYRDENGNEITRTALQSKTGEAVAINPVLPAGWELVPGQSIPAIVMTTPDGIPDVVILIKHQMITVKPGEKAPTGKVPGNPSTTYEKMESLTKEITRTITVKLSDGQRQIITQTVKFTRTATFDAVTGKATYSAWQVDGSNEWPAYPAPEINGYTASQVSIPAELVIPSDENQSIEIEYTKNNQPVEPDKPVTPITPDQPTTPTNPDQPVTSTQPAQPTEPSVPAKPIAPTNNGDKVMSGNQLPTEPVEQEKQQVSNQHFISHKLTQTSSKENSKANILPQTGNDQNSGSILGFAFAALASILGLTGLKKKKREK
ncbi:MBG domain-containing protein [Limosilactobacillus reuteri]|uniref:MBG domain-containing protein n=1 Tax=Limosilactobacillus reuteri TaxID=1598 RepID=UPI003D992081